MSRHSAVEEQLVDWLTREKGFDRSYLLEDPTFTNSKGLTNVRPDVVAIDGSTGDPVAIFEVKSELTADRRAKCIAQLVSYAEIDKDRSIPVFLVAASTSGPGIEFHKLTDDNELEEVVGPALPNYHQFRAAILAPKLIGARQEAKKMKDHFQLLCIGVSVALLLIGVVDFFLERRGVELLTTNRMILLGTAVALLVIPYAQRFKGLGIEYERLAALPTPPTDRGSGDD